jgi:MoxR-like ATPase
MPPDLTAADVQTLLARVPRLRAEIGKAIIGQHVVVEELLTAFIAGGHCLLEGLPGLGKTLLIRTLAQAVQLTFHRIQFTPDLMPSDIIGTEVLEEDHATGRRFFQFNRGPIFGQLILADEINRTPPKTQAALLEAMQENAVTYGGKTYALERPFFVLATQNPIEQSGTYPLPEAQLDRFLLYLTIDYPAESDELTMLARTTGAPMEKIEPVMTAAEIGQLQQIARSVLVSDELLGYINRLVRATRDRAHPKIGRWVRWGAGPRAGQSLVLAAKARALLAGRFAVTLDDIRTLAAPVLRHRVLLTFEAEAENVTRDQVVSELLAAMPEPVSPLTPDARHRTPDPGR